MCVLAISPWFCYSASINHITYLPAFLHVHIVQCILLVTLEINCRSHVMIVLHQHNHNCYIAIGLCDDAHTYLYYKFSTAVIQCHGIIHFSMAFYGEGGWVGGDPYNVELL